MRTLSLIAFSTLLMAQTGFSQVNNPVHPTEAAINTWLSTGHKNNTNECKSSRAVPQICLVTVDLDSNWNHVYWDKTGMLDVDYFKIYRETPLNSGTYTAIDSVDYDSLSFYTDKNVDTYFTSSRYKISAVDTAGVEGALSLYHRTIFCDEPTEGTFDWDDYEIEASPSPVLQFVLLRKDSIGDPWVPIDTIASTTTFFDDTDHALFPDGEWRVRTIWPITCTPTRAGISTSRSNLRTKSMLTTGSGINGPVADKNNFNLYPNPADDMVIVEFASGNDKLNTIFVRDATGRIVDQKTTIYNKVQFNLSGFSKGTYFIEAVNSNGKSTKIFIKN
ncbi:MAG TPA: T9SS type A sorting domain-containing protein [Flavobacteriales bacterium]|nr:T9SS type A sorting domain-containing protein [Flavobacteriales bacterium]